MTMQWQGLVLMSLTHITTRDHGDVLGLCCQGLSRSGPAPRLDSTAELLLVVVTGVSWPCGQEHGSVGAATPQRSLLTFPEWHSTLWPGYTVGSPRSNTIPENIPALMKEEELALHLTGCHTQERGSCILPGQQRRADPCGKGAGEPAL